MKAAQGLGNLAGRVIEVPSKVIREQTEQLAQKLLSEEVQPMLNMLSDAERQLGADVNQLARTGQETVEGIERTAKQLGKDVNQLAYTGQETVEGIERIAKQLGKDVNQLACTGQETVREITRIVNTASVAIPASIARAGEALNQFVETAAPKVREEAQRATMHFTEKTLPRLRQEAEQAVDHAFDAAFERIDKFVKARLEPIKENVAEAAKEITSKLKLLVAGMIVASTVPFIAVLLLEILRYISSRQKGEQVAEAALEGEGDA